MIIRYGVSRRVPNVKRKRFESRNDGFEIPDDMLKSISRISPDQLFAAIWERVKTEAAAKYPGWSLQGYAIQEKSDPEDQTFYCPICLELKLRNPQQHSNGFIAWCEHGHIIDVVKEDPRHHSKGEYLA